MGCCPRAARSTGSLDPMSEAHAPVSGPDPKRTGVREVDAVLESLEDLESTDVAEHPAAFESAHEQLRRALDSES